LFIYTIGALTFYHRINLINKGLEWRNKVCEWGKDNNVKVFNPAINFIKERNHRYEPRLCVDQNDYYIDKCDIAIANLNDIDFSPGSIYELVRFRELRKPVIAFGQRNWSPHVNACISHQCETLDEVFELLCNMFEQGNF
jgi:nucleoside 2-deoxyribosyltransferase